MFPWLVEMVKYPTAKSFILLYSIIGSNLAKLEFMCIQKRLKLV